MRIISPKKVLFSLAVLMSIMLFITSCSGAEPSSRSLLPMPSENQNFASMSIINPDSEIRGVWIASVFNIDYPSSNGLSAAELQAELDAILSTCAKNKLNTIFFQVRPACDALYKSKIFPVSSYISPNGTLSFDPLEYLVEKAHSMNIYVHAWVNPLRVTVSGTDLNALPASSPAKQNPDWVVPYADGKLYFNAGLAEVRQLIADGVREIVENYDVDGVVFDDYFYPYPVWNNDGTTEPFDDAEEFESYGGMFDTVDDWRRDNINQIIRLCYNTVHEADPECQFGVSPTGVWQNDNGTNGGSDTRGFESYKYLYCDALAWIDGGYIDYISPQIYWDFATKETPYDVVLRWWNTALDGTDIKLYVSHGSYRYEDGEWASPKGQLTEQVEFARSELAYRGSIFYGYDEINRNINGASDDLLSAYKNEIIYTDIASNGQGVTVNSPANGTVLNSDSTYLIGLSDPYYPLTLNGKKIGRTKSGFFSLYVPLEQGENTFTFVQNGTETTHTVYYNLNTADSGGSTQTENIVRLDSFSVTPTYPLHNVTTSDKELWVSCTAPYGSWVTATLNGVQHELVPLEDPRTKYIDNGYVGVTYGKLLSLPVPSDGTILDAGNIVFTAYGHVTASTEGCRVRLMGKDAKIAVRVLEDYTNLKFTETSSYYNDYTVQSAGMTDFIVSQRNGFYQLRMGGFVAEGDVEETTDFPSPLTDIASVSVKVAKNGTEIRVECADKPAYYGVVDNGCFVLTFYNINAETAPEPSIGKNPLFDSCEVIRLPDSNRVRYSFKLKDVRNFYGFDLHYEDSPYIKEKYTVVTLRNPISIDLNSEKPLLGTNIVLDAGHGGWDNGAAGAMVGFAEKDINLAVTLEVEKKLTELGASVTLTRPDDTYLDLYDRMDFLEEHEPDLCVSIHQNSMDYSTDITKIRGTLSLYCMDSGLLLAQCIGESVSSATNRAYLGAQYQMLAMCRNPKFPASLIEVGFMTNVEEYEQMANGSGIEKAAQGITDGIIRYFEIQSEFCN